MMLWTVTVACLCGLARAQSFGGSTPPLKVTHEVTFFIAQGDNINSQVRSLGEVHHDSSPSFQSMESFDIRA